VRGIFKETSPSMKQQISKYKHDRVIHILIKKLEKD